MLPRRFALTLSALAIAALASPTIVGQTSVITVPLTYHSPGTGPKPNFSPKGTQVTLSAVAKSSGRCIDFEAEVG